MTRRFLYILAAGAVIAQTPDPKPIRIAIQQFKLENGLRVNLSEDHSAPTFSLCVVYNVGSRDEKPGRTGFAHLFEHMMFQGSENIGKGEHNILVENNGGGENGTTNEERTSYYETFPANQLDLGLFLEADRMKSLAINQANLDNQRNAVQEERRLGLDNQAYGKSQELIEDVAFDNPANKHSVIGSMEDLSAASLEDVREFFRIYYAPNNAVLSLVGDFNSAEALAKIKKYFSSIPKQSEPPRTNVSEPPQTAERRKTIDDGFARTPRVDIVFRIPPANTPDWHALSVLANVLSAGQSSRFYQTIVKEKELATNVRANAAEHRGPSLFYISAVLRPGKDPGDVEKAVYAELDRLKNEPIADWELQKERMSARRGSAQQMQSTLFRAFSMSQLTAYFDDPEIINTRPLKLRQVTREDVERVAKKYFTPENRTVITTLVKGKEAPKAQPGE